MSKAYSVHLNTITMKNEATTSVQPYTLVRLCTTANSCDIITTRGTVPPFGIAQELIDPDATGEVAISGISRLKMGSTGYTTMMVTTPMNIGANASGNGVVLTTSVTLHLGALGLSTFAASDIVAVEISKNRAVYRV